jgi:TP901 family phage tail tape measure protein
MAATVGNLRVELSVGVRKAMTALNRFNSSLEQTRASMEAMSGAAKTVTLAMGAATAATAVTFAKFEASLTRAAAVASGGAKGFEQSFSAMSASAIELAGRSQFTAKQVAEGMGFMAMAGNDAKQTIEAMPAAIMLASAAQQDLASATDTVTNIMAGFNIKADENGTTSQKLAEANNILVGTFANANVSLTELGEAMKIAGPVASTLGASIEDVSAALGILGNAGIKGTDAGTGLKRIFTSLAKDSVPKVKKALNTLGVSLDLVEKEGLSGMIRQLERAKRALGDQAFTGKIFEAFGEIAGPKLAALVGQGSAAMDKLLGKIKKAKSENITEFLQEKQLSTLSGQFDILISNAEAAAIRFGERLAPALKPVAEGLMKVFKALTVLNDEQIDSLITLGKWIAGSAALVIAVGTLSSALTAITGVISGFAAAATAAGGVMSMSFVPVLAVAAAGIAGLALGLKVYEEATNKSISLTQSFSDVLTDLSSDARGTELVFDQMADAIRAIAPTIEDTANSVKTSMEITEKAVRAGLDKKQSPLYDTLIKGAETLKARLAELKEEAAALNAQLATPGRFGEDISNSQLGLNIKKKLAKVTEQIAATERDILANQREGQKVRERIRYIADRRKRLAEQRAEAEKEARKEAEKAAALEAKRIRERERAQKRREEFMKRLAKMRKDAERYLERLRTDVPQQTARIEAGEFGGLLGNIQDFQNEIGEVAKSFKVLGKKADLSGINDTTQILEDRLMAQARAFVDSKRGTEDFAETVQRVVRMINKEIPGLDVKESDFTKEDPLKKARDVVAAFRKQYEETGTIMGDAVKDSGEDFKDNISDIWKNLDTSSLSAYLQSGLENVLQFLTAKMPKGGSIDTFAIESMVGAAAGASGGGIGGMIGAAIGSAVPGIGTAVGAAAGQIAEQAIGSAMVAVENAFYDAADAIERAAQSIAGIVPEGRIAGAVKESVQPVVQGIRDLGPAAAVVVPALAALAAVALSFAPGLALLALSFGPIIAFFGTFIAIAVAPLLAFVAAILLIHAIIIGAITAFAASLLGIVGVFAFLGNLAKETESFADMMAGFEAVADELIMALEPLFNVIGPRLVGLFKLVIGALLPWADTLANSQALFVVVFEGAKLLALGFVSLLFAAAAVQNALIDIAQFMVNIPQAFFNGIANFVNALINGAAAFLDGVATVMDAIPGVTGAAVRTAAAEVRSGVVSALRPEELQQVSQGLESMRVDLDEAGNAVRRVAEATTDSTYLLGEEVMARKEGLESLSEALVNAPQGFKVALERFRAIQTGGAAFNADPFGTDEGGAPNVQNNFGTFIVQVNTEEEARSVIDLILEQGNFDMAGAGSGKQFNPGFG